MSAPTVPVTVVVAFYSRSGATETRALTAAVGAVNARALIRMRRLPDVGGSTRPDGSASDAELARMRKEYVPPTEADVVGADALILAVPAGSGVTSAEWAPLASLLTSLATQRKVQGKVAAVVAGGSDADNAASAAFLLERGFVLVPPEAVDTTLDAGNALARVQAHGRLVAHVTRAVKSIAR